MKRKAILIGNPSGLVGIDKDLNDFEKFLKSTHGGAWLDAEIIRLFDKTKKEVLETLAAVRKEANNLVYVIYSGHGGFRNGTILEINSNDEQIEETVLYNLAPKQVNILDCCRALIPAIERVTESRQILFSNNDIKSAYRKEFEKQIMERPDQELHLYSCKIGECSYPSERGSYYIQNILEAVKELLKSNSSVTAYKAHVYAQPLTSDQVAKDLKKKQTPEMVGPKLLTSLYLPLAIKL